jgi:hypothetical protein
MKRWIALLVLATTSILLCVTQSSVAQGAGDKKESDGKPDSVKAADSKPADSKPLATPRRPGAKNASGVLDITFDDLKFDIEKGGKFERSMLPQKIEDLKGKKLTLRGYILPASVFQREGFKSFTLVRDDKECCFGPMAAIYDCARIEMVGDASANFTTRPITVEGEFKIEEWLIIDGRPMAIFHVLAKSAK